MRPEDVIGAEAAAEYAGAAGPVDGEMSSMHRRIGVRASAAERFVLMCEEACFYEIERAREANAAGKLDLGAVVETQEVLEKVLARAEALAADPAFIDEQRAAEAAEALKRPQEVLPNPANELLRERVAVLRLCMESLAKEEAEWVALQNKADADDEAGAAAAAQGGAAAPRERTARSGGDAAMDDPAAAPIAKALDIAAFHTDAVRSMVSNVQRLGERAMALCRKLAAEYEAAVMGTINAPEDAKALIRKLNA